jgi:hypothetical protein
MLARLVFACALCGLCGAAYAGDAGTSPPGTPLDPPASAAAPSSSPGADKFIPAGNAPQTAKVPALDADIGSVHMSLHIMGGAAAGGVIRP